MKPEHRRRLRFCLLYAIALVFLAISIIMWRNDSRAQRYRQPVPEAELREALGDLADVPAGQRIAFSDFSAFTVLPPPGPADWLSWHYEPGQPNNEYNATTHRPDATRRVINLVPLGEFPAAERAWQQALAEYVELFYGVPTRWLPAIPLPVEQFTPRVHPVFGKRQLASPKILEWLGPRKPADAFCLAAITREDLYADPDFGFVFGQASPAAGTAVYSFARYDEAFYGETRPVNFIATYRRRTLGVVTHELGHNFGMGHCVFFRCLMNGSSSLKEGDGAPLWLCPICLRKMHRALGFDVRTRYAALGRFCRKFDLIPEADWYERQARKCQPQ